MDEADLDRRLERRRGLSSLRLDLSDEAVEDAIRCSRAFSEIMGMSFGAGDQAPDAATLLKFRRTIESHGLGRKMLGCVGAILEKKGATLRGGPAGGGAFVEVPPPPRTPRRSVIPRRPGPRRAATGASASRPVSAQPLLISVSLEKLTGEFSKGFSTTSLKQMRHFYRVYSDEFGKDFPLATAGRKFFLGWPLLPWACASMPNTKQGNRPGCLNGARPQKRACRA